MSQLANCPGFPGASLGHLRVSWECLRGAKWEKRPGADVRPGAAQEDVPPRDPTQGVIMKRLLISAGACLRPHWRRGKCRRCGLPEGPLRGRRLDRHPGDDRRGLGAPRSARLRARSQRLGRAGDLRLAQEQGHRRLPRQLDAEHDHRRQALHRDDKSVESMQQNLDDAGYGLVVPAICGGRRSEESRRISAPTRTSSAARSTASRPAMTATASSST